MLNSNFFSRIVSTLLELYEQRFTEIKQMLNQEKGKFKTVKSASGQDEGVGRHTVPPCTTKRMTTTI